MHHHRLGQCEQQMWCVCNQSVCRAWPQNGSSGKLRTHRTNVTKNHPRSRRRYQYQPGRTTRLNATHHDDGAHLHAIARLRRRPAKTAAVKRKVTKEGQSVAWALSAPTAAKVPAARDVESTSWSLRSIYCRHPTHPSPLLRCRWRVCALLQTALGHTS